MLLYIHGYQGEPGVKGELAQRVFGDLCGEVRKPQLHNVDAFSDLRQLNALLPPEGEAGSSPHLVIGNSLGGFYAWHLCSQRQDCICFMLNPALLPFVTLRKIPEVSADLEQQLYLKFTETYPNAYRSRVFATYCLDDELIPHAEITEPLMKPLPGVKGFEPVLFPVPHGGHGWEDFAELEKIFVKVKDLIKPVV